MARATQLRRSGTSPVARDMRSPTNAPACCSTGSTPVAATVPTSAGCAGSAPWGDAERNTLLVNHWEHDDPETSFERYTRLEDPIPGGLTGMWIFYDTWDDDESGEVEQTLTFTITTDTFTEVDQNVYRNGDVETNSGVSADPGDFRRGCRTMIRHGRVAATRPRSDGEAVIGVVFMRPAPELGDTLLAEV